MVVHLLLLKCSMAGPFVNFADAMVIYNWVKCLLNTSKWITTDISLVARSLSWLSLQFFEAQNNFFLKGETRQLSARDGNTCQQTGLSNDGESLKI